MYFVVSRYGNKIIASLGTKLEGNTVTFLTPITNQEILYSSPGDYVDL